MKTTRNLAAAAAVTALLFGAGCSSDAAEAEPEPTASVDARELTAEKAAEAVESFFAEATSDEIAAVPVDKYDEKTFAAAAKKIDPAAPQDKSSDAIADIAWLKVENPDAKLEFAVDAEKVEVKDETATVPAEAVKITRDGKDVAETADIAAHVGNLVYKDEWLIAFPEVKKSVDEEAGKEAAPSTSPSAKK